MLVRTFCDMCALQGSSLLASRAVGNAVAFVVVVHGCYVCACRTIEMEVCETVEIEVVLLGLS